MRGGAAVGSLVTDVGNGDKKAFFAYLGLSGNDAVLILPRGFSICTCNGVQGARYPGTRSKFLRFPGILVLSDFDTIYEHQQRRECQGTMYTRADPNPKYLASWSCNPSRLEMKETEQTENAESILSANRSLHTLKNTLSITTRRRRDTRLKCTVMGKEMNICASWSTAWYIVPAGLRCASLTYKHTISHA